MIAKFFILSSFDIDGFRELWGQTMKFYSVKLDHEVKSSTPSKVD